MRKNKCEKIKIIMENEIMTNEVAENVEEILDKLEPHCPQLTRVHRTTYFRWRDQAFEAVGSILWGCEGECEKMMKQFSEEFQEI